MHIQQDTTGGINMRLYAAVLFLLAAFMGFFPSVTHAQWNIAQSKPLELTVTPAFPKPDTKVTVSVGAYSMDLTGARITWYQDGEELTWAKDLRSIEVQTGTVGKTINMSATISPAAGVAFTLKKSITPAAVDIIVEAFTHVPSFYRGRAIPSADSQVRVIAVPNLGKDVDPRTLSYRWEQNGGVLLGGPVRGKQSIDVTVPRYTGGRLRVIISDAQGSPVADASIALEAMNPEVLFYEENPLRGLSENIIRKNFTLIGDETTVHAEPYFMNKKYGVYNSGITYEWSINGQPANMNTTDPSVVTLRRTGGAGSAGVSLRTYTNEKLPQLGQGSFMINF